MNTLYLASNELILLKSLPVTVRDAWKGKVVEETVSAYETPEVIRVRMAMLPLEKYPQMKDVTEGFIAQSEAIESFSDMSFLKQFPEELLPEFLFAIGAIGISALVESILHDGLGEEGWKNLALLTVFRHKILEANAKYFVA